MWTLSHIHYDVGDGVPCAEVYAYAMGLHALVWRHVGRSTTLCYAMGYGLCAICDVYM